MAHSERPLQILLIEDDQDHAELVKRSFEDHEEPADLIVVSSLSEARAYLARTRPGLIIADWRLPDGESLDLLDASSGSGAPPIVVMTSYGNERTAVRAIKSGALDYVVKSSETMLDMPHIAERAIQRWNGLQEQEQLRKALEEREAQFRLLAQNSSDIISRHNLQGQILYISPACRALLGYEPEEMLNQSIYRYIHPEDTRRMGEFIAALVEKNARSEITYCLRKKTGDYVWVETIARLVFDPRSGQLAEIQASTRDITERVQNQTSLQQAHNELREAYDKTIEGWVRALDLRDHETEGHTQRVTDLTMRMAKRLGCFKEEEMVHIRRGALLHDIGKMGVPDEILLKRGPLDANEWVQMRLHPTYAHDWLYPINYLRPALTIPYYHHERWNGSGYPQGLAGEAIPLEARLFCLGDVFDAMTNDRHYRKKGTVSDALDFIRSNAGVMFDPDLVGLFIEVIEK